ncbi:MAG TPA: type I-U CRISPR-associated helicase/endonuclease Cas3 [Methylovirgula sp.]|nr:type I-U CRISPR-associated helicase/endonuclease Cas3 [Methylovirgula sp.]
MSAATPSFQDSFYSLTGYSPMRWQSRLFDQLIKGNIPAALDLPTGLGKTSVMAIWLIALAEQTAAGAVGLPRRLVYVVDRRTVVDQATDEALKLRNTLKARDSNGAAGWIRGALDKLCVDHNDDASPLAISTLRGELADNREWQADPGRAAIVIGTVDMIGSRLLFSSYGNVGWKMRAFNAGLIAHDTLIVHDETQLSPAFGELLRQIENGQQGKPRRLRVLSLSATRRPVNPAQVRDSAPADIFPLTDEDRGEDLVNRRTGAAKALRFHDAPDVKLLPQRLADLALAHRDAKARVLVYVRSPEDAKEVRRVLSKAVGSEAVEVLTGTLRGRERDGLAGTALFKSFIARLKREPVESSRFLVATSAGEVGVNLDADHLVCDLTTLDSMIQRLGRVNRLGRDDADFVARVDVCVAPAKDDDLGVRLDKTRSILKSLPRRDGDAFAASPAELAAIVGADSVVVEEAFSKTPRLRRLTDILLDKWALTSVRDMPGRPPVEDWLHGIEGEPPETAVAWREEVADLVRHAVDGGDIDDWLEVHPIKAWERLRDRSSRAAECFKKMAARRKEGDPPIGALLIRPDRKTQRIEDLAKLADAGLIANATVILPKEAGGLSDGLLDGDSRDATDVADIVPDKSDSAKRARVRIWRIGEQGWKAQLLGSADGQGDLTNIYSELDVTDLLDKVITKITERFDFKEKERLVLREDEDEVHVLVAFGESRSIETALDTSAAARSEQTLLNHLDWTCRAAAAIVARLGLDIAIRDAVVLAARWHDQGKDRQSWQRAIGNREPKHPLAKSGHGRFDNRVCAGYRHEFGSLIDAANDPGIRGNPEQDLILHLIACHHGRARPHFEEREFDPQASSAANNDAAAEAVRRYARLSRRFGHWQLAWLEALMKCADVIATKRGKDVEELR